MLPLIFFMNLIEKVNKFNGFDEDLKMERIMKP